MVREYPHDPKKTIEALRTRKKGLVPAPGEGVKVSPGRVLAGKAVSKGDIVYVSGSAPPHTPYYAHHPATLAAPPPEPLFLGAHPRMRVPTPLVYDDHELFRISHETVPWTAIKTTNFDDRQLKELIDSEYKIWSIRTEGMLQAAVVYRDAALEVFGGDCRVTTSHPSLEGTVLVIPISAADADDTCALTDKREKIFDIVERNNPEYLGEAVITFEIEAENADTSGNL